MHMVCNKKASTSLEHSLALIRDLLQTESITIGSLSNKDYN